MPRPSATPRRRDGQPVQPTPAEQELAAQRARVARPAGGGTVIPAAAAAGGVAAALAALLAAGKTAKAAAAGGGAVELAIHAAAIAQATAAILAAFDRAHTDRREQLPARVDARLARELPAAAPDILQPLVRSEVEREREFQAKAHARLQRDLPEALAITDPEERRVAVRRILQREERYAELREDAIAARAGGRASFDRMRGVLEPQGVTGMFWRLNPRLEHCAKCLALGGKIWPWPVLELYHPPMHLNCGCGLWAPEDAFRLGWATPADVVSVDAAISMMHLLEASVDVVRDPEGMWLVEAGACGCAS